MSKQLRAIPCWILHKDMTLTLNVGFFFELLDDNSVLKVIFY